MNVSLENKGHGNVVDGVPNLFTAVHTASMTFSSDGGFRTPNLFESNWLAICLFHIPRMLSIRLEPLLPLFSLLLPIPASLLFLANLLLRLDFLIEFHALVFGQLPRPDVAVFSACVRRSRLLSVSIGNKREMRHVHVYP